MKVLVTGGAGFIGSHVVDRLLADGHVPKIFDLVHTRYSSHDGVETCVGDVADPLALAQAAQGCDAVIHLAAVADVNDVLANPLRAASVNIIGTQHALEAARSAGVDRFVYASTVWVYGNGRSEASVDEETPPSPPSHPYTATKLAGEMLVHSYGDLYGVGTTTVRLGIPFGPRSRDAAVVAAFVHRASSRKALNVAGDGRQRRQFVYVADLASGIVATLAAPATGRVYNLVGEASTSVLEIANTVRRLVADVPIVHSAARAGDPYFSHVSGARAAAELGWRATTSFEDGVRRYVDWLTETSGSPVSTAAATIAGSAETVLRQEAGEL